MTRSCSHNCVKLILKHSNNIVEPNIISSYSTFVVTHAWICFTSFVKLFKDTVRVFVRRIHDAAGRVQQRDEEQRVRAGGAAGGEHRRADDDVNEESDFMVLRKICHRC